MSQANLEFFQPRQEATLDAPFSDRRRRARLMFWCCLLLVLVGLPLAGYATSFWTSSRIVLSVTVLSPFTICFCFLGGYIGFGNRADRWIVAPIASCVVSALVGYFFGGREFWIFVAMGALTTVVAASASSFLRVVKGELTVVQEGMSTSEAFQFGIKDLLVLTTVAAAVIAIGQFALSYDKDIFRSGGIVFIVVSCVFCLIFPLFVNFWSFFGEKLTHQKLIFNGAATIASLVGIILVLPGKPWWPVTLVVNQILFGLLMWTLRNQGFRFIKRKSGVVTV